MALPFTIVSTPPSLAVPIVGPFQGSKAYYSVSTGQANFLPIGDLTYQQVGESFTTPVVGDNRVTRTTASLYKIGSPADTVKADIYLADGASLPTGPSLATSLNAIPGSAVVGVYSASFLFDPFTLTNGVKYVVALSRTGSLDAGNYFGYITNANSTDALQTGSYWNGSAWIDTGYDFPLQVHGLGDIYYFFGRSSTTPTTLNAYRSVSPDLTWTFQTSRSGFTTEILSVSAVPSGPNIHILVQDGTAPSLIGTKYTVFNTVTNGFVFPEIVSAPSAAGIAGGAIAARNNGEAIALYNGVQTATSGPLRSRLYSRRRDPASFTWTTEEQVDLNDDTDNTMPVAVRGAADRIHFGFQAGSAFTVRTLTAANALTTSTASMTGPSDAVSFPYSSNTRVVFTQNGTGSKNAYFDSSDTPTITVSDQSIATATIPHRVATDNGEVIHIYRSSVDGDLYMIKSTDGGATYGAPVLLFAGTVAEAETGLSRSLSGSVYPRGLNITLSYLVNDNGELKYNEYIVRAPAPANEMRVRHVGVWKKPITYIKQAGVWTVATPYAKHAGTWKQMV